MKQELTLLILAAGMGSRFGGLKQIEPFGPHGEFLTDFSIYDAIQAGFTKVVFMIKEEHLQDFQDTIGKRIENFIPVEYAFQKMEDIPVDIAIPSSRKKPWGTAHAIYCARNHIQGNFVMINADDFYGRDAFMQIASFMRNAKASNGVQPYGMVGYLVENTLTDYGTVKRGVCEVQDGYLHSMIESSIERKDGEIVASPLDGRPSFVIQKEDYVSMNLSGFTDTIFHYIEEDMTSFFEKNRDSLDTCEFLIPDVLQKAINEKKATVRVLRTTAKWIGVTYKEDSENVIHSLQKMIQEGVYPENLWEK